MQLNTHSEFDIFRKVDKIISSLIEKGKCIKKKEKELKLESS